jgi:uncharacterized protein
LIHEEDLLNKTLFILKPDSVERNLVGRILAKVEAAGFVIRRMEMVRLSPERARKFYAVHKGKPFLDDLVEYMSSGPCPRQGGGGDDTRRVRFQHPEQLRPRLRLPGVGRDRDTLLLPGRDGPATVIHAAGAAVPVAETGKDGSVKILVQDLPEGHSMVTRREAAEALDLLEWFRPLGPVDVELDVERRGERLTLRGSVKAEAEQACARCAKTFASVLESEVLFLAERRGTDDPRDEAALEEEGEVLYHDGVELDLDAPLREALILELPVVVVCRPECKGLCPRCGKDLNEDVCSCGSSTEDPRWETLKGLKEEEDS